MEVDRASSALARRALLITSSLATAGSGLGVVGIRQGTAAGAEAILILFNIFISAGIVAVVLYRKVELQTVATVATGYFGVYLCACSGLHPCAETPKLGTGCHWLRHCLQQPDNR